MAPVGWLSTFPSSMHPGLIPPPGNLRRSNAMKVTRIFAALALVVGVAGVAHAQCARLSWGTCDPWVENMNFTAPISYLLVESAQNVALPNVAHDSHLHIGAFSGAVPDCWRFDDP